MHVVLRAPSLREQVRGQAVHLRKGEVVYDVGERNQRLQLHAVTTLSFVA